MIEYQLTMGGGVETIKHYGTLQSTRQFSRKISGQMNDVILNALGRCRFCNIISSDVVEENNSIQLAIDLSIERTKVPKDRLESLGNAALLSENYLMSTNGIFKLFVQQDGNLVLYKNGKAKWSTGTRGTMCRLVLQLDGNLVLTCNEGVKWSTSTSKYLFQGPFRFNVQTDGNLALYTAKGAVIWTSNTAGVVATLAENEEYDPESYEEETLDERPQSEEEF
jgi:hypothetical protein